MMATRLDDGRIVFASVVREVMPDAREPKPLVRRENPMVELQRILAGAVPVPQKSQYKARKKRKEQGPRWSDATVRKVRALRALGLPHWIIGELTGVPPRTSTDITKCRQNRYLGEPTEADILSAGASIAQWAIEQRYKAKAA